MIKYQMLNSKNIRNTARATKKEVPSARAINMIGALMFPSDISSTSFIKAWAEGSEHTTAPPIKKAIGSVIQLYDNVANILPKTVAVGMNAISVPKKKRHKPM